MFIRKAKKEDIADLSTIKNKQMDHLFLKRIKEMEEGKAVYLVAEENNEVVAHVFLKFYGLPHIPDYPSIEDLAVRLDQRKKGIGKALIGECEARAKEKGFHMIGIQVNPSPDCPARMLYERLGFKDVGNKPYVDGVYDGVKDWVIDMSKELT